MNKRVCFLCFADTYRVTFVKNTRLQNINGELSNYMVQSESHPLCYICYKRLFQFEQLFKQILELQTEYNQSREKPLVNLSAKNDYTEVAPEDLYKFYVPIIEHKQDTHECLNEDTNSNGIMNSYRENYSASHFNIKEEDLKTVMENTESEIATEANDKQEKETQTTDDNDKPYSCEFCSKKFITNGNLNRHKRTHIIDKPFSCDICSKEFNANCNLKRHRRIHIGDKPYGCNMCTKSFFEKSDLERHIKFHTGEKPYACDMCSKKFIRKGLLEEHKLVHSGVKSYTCDICDKKLSTISTLKAHKRQHAAMQPYPCDVCSKVFNSKGNLDGHKKIHSDNRYFSCDVCNKKVTSKRNLKRHKLIHMGLKPYSCDICGTKFSDSSCLIRHRKKMHIDIHISQPQNTQKKKI